MRGLRHRLLLIPVLLAAWAWFGLSGALPVVIWWWHRRPREGHGTWQVDPARARSARLGPWRTTIRFRGQPAVEIFHDEIRPEDLALLRRALKAQLARD